MKNLQVGTQVPKDIINEKNISYYNNHKIFFLPLNRYWTIDVQVNIEMSNQELDTYLSYRVTQTTNKKVLFLYIKQQNSYLVFISNKLYIEKLIKRYPKTSITPLSVFYKSFLGDNSWSVFNINKNSAFVITNINKVLTRKPLPISLSHLEEDTKDIIKAIVIFIDNIMPHIDKIGAIKSIYFDSDIRIIQKLDGKNVFNNINIQKLRVENFNPVNLAFDFAKIKSFRFYFLIGLFALALTTFFSAETYLNISNEEIMQNIKSQNKQSKTINSSMKTIKDIKNQIITIQKHNNEQIILNSNFSNRILKILSSQNKTIKIIVLDKNNSYVK